jgi:dynactin complex subunit
VKKDPSTGGTDAMLIENVAVAKTIAADLDSAVTMINALENVRGQLAALKSTMGGDSTRKDVVATADSLDLKLRVVERKLFQTRATGRGQDELRWPQRISEQLQYLAGEIQSSDFAPTESQKQVADLLRAQVRAVKTEFDRVMAGDVAAFNAMLQQRKVPNVISN